MTTFAGVWSVPSFVANVTDVELDAIRALFAVWQEKYPRNLLRSQYYDMKVRIKPTGNMPAEAIARVEAVSDWPEKAVTSLAERSVFEGFVSSGDVRDPYDIEGILAPNRFRLELPQAISSAYKHSCSFITTAMGDVASGEPEVLVMAREALWTAARWDSKRRRVRDVLSITGTDEVGQPTSMHVLFPDVVLVLERRPSGAWVADRRPNPLGEVLAEPLTFDPQLGRPFGRSRISRAVMNLTDRALLTIIRSEISSDFYASPRMFALGVAEEAFSRGKWQAAVDSWFAISKDEDGDKPTVGQFPQMTMQPLTDMYRTIATQFSGATGVSVSALGIVTDNPPSAEALFMEDRHLVEKAERQNRIFTESLVQVARRAIRLRDGADVDPSDLTVNWVNPARTSAAAKADALTKLANVFPWLAESEVGLEFAGFSNAEIKRLLADKARYDNRAFARAVSAMAGGSDAAVGSGSASSAVESADGAGVV